MPRYHFQSHLGAAIGAFRYSPAAPGCLESHYHQCLAAMTDPPALMGGRWEYRPAK